MSGRWIQSVRTPDPNQAPPNFHSSLTIATGLAAILLPATLAFSIVARQRYCQQLMQQRIAHLERSWRLKSAKNTHTNS